MKYRSIILTGLILSFSCVKAQLDQRLLINDLGSLQTKNIKLSAANYNSLNNFYLTKTDTSVFFYTAATKHIDTYFSRNNIKSINNDAINTELSKAILEFTLIKWPEVSIDSEPSNVTITLSDELNRKSEHKTKCIRRLPPNSKYYCKFHCDGYKDTMIVINPSSDPVKHIVLKKK